MWGGDPEPPRLGQEGEVRGKKVGGTGGWEGTLSGELWLDEWHRKFDG